MVECSEIVQVEEGDGEWVALASTSVDLKVKLLVKRPSIAYAC
jgi:hypothetical protein